jgi:SH3 domain protein
MRTTALLILALWAAAPALASRTRYITDDVSLSLCEQPNNQASALAIVHSGDEVTQLETRGPDSYAPVRTVDGREGWIAARHLSDRPAARRLLSVAPISRLAV